MGLRFGGLPMRSTQPEKYSRKQHDLSVRIQRLKRPLMEKGWIPKLWASMRASIWTYGRPNSGQGARRYGPRNTCCADKSENQTDFLPRLFWGSYLRFQGKQWIPKLEIISWHTIWTPNLHYLESVHRRYGVGKEGLRNRKIWTRLILWKPSLLLSQGRSRARQGGTRPKAPQGHKYNPLGAQGRGSNPPRTRRKPRAKTGGRRRPPQVFEGT